MFIILEGRELFDTQGQKIYHARRVTLQIDQDCNTKCAPASIEDWAWLADIKHIRSYVLCPGNRNMEYFQKSSEILKPLEDKSTTFMAVPLVIDSLDFVCKAEVRRGKIAIAGFQRLQDYLASNSGELGYAVTGVLDANGRPVLRVDIQGIVNLQCQRCLEELKHVLDIHTELLLAQNEQELQHFDEDESLDCILAQPDMDVLSLIEDEIILGLPVSPRHEQSRCTSGGREDGKATRKVSPFAALAALKKTH